LIGVFAKEIINTYLVGYTPEYSRSCSALLELLWHHHVQITLSIFSENTEAVRVIT